MKKNVLCLLLIIFCITSFNLFCSDTKKRNSLIGAVKKGSKEQKNRIALVGRVFFDPEIKQPKNVMPLDLRNALYLVFLKDEKREIIEVTLTDINTSVNANFNEYFVGWVNKDIKLLKAAITTEGNGYLSYQTLSKIDIQEDDKILYIGDLYFKIEPISETLSKSDFTKKTVRGKNLQFTAKLKNKISLKIVDNFDEVKTEFDGFLLNKDGSPIEIQKRLLENDDNVVGKILLENQNNPFMP